MLVDLSGQVRIDDLGGVTQEYNLDYMFQSRNSMQGHHPTTTNKTILISTLNSNYQLKKGEKNQRIRDVSLGDNLRGNELSSNKN